MMVINPFNLLILNAFLIIITNSAVQFTVSNINISFPSPINQMFSQCFGPNVNFYLILSTSNYTSQHSFSISQQDGSQNVIKFTNISTFIINSPTDFISLSGILQISCGSLILDSFPIFSQTSKQADNNNIKQSQNSYSTSNQWFLSTDIYRICNGVGQYGFNCNQQCTNTDNINYCFTCEANGQKRCCSNVDVDQNDCSYYDHPTTQSPQNVDCDSSQENLYFWFMIGFVIATFILLVFVIVLILIVLGCFSQSSKSGTDDEWINEPVDARAKKHLYDGELNRRYERRNVQEIRNNNSPYIVGREGLENQSYYDDSSIDIDMGVGSPKREVRV